MSIRPTLLTPAIAVLALSVTLFCAPAKSDPSAPTPPVAPNAPANPPTHSIAPSASNPVAGYALMNPGLFEDIPATPTVTAPGYNSDDVSAIESSVVDKMWAQTDDYWHAGDYPRIVDLDELIVQIDPHFMEPYSVGGWLIESMGDYKTAEQFYRLGVANNPNDSYMYYMLAAFYFNTLHDYQSAANVMQVGVTKRGNDVNDWRMYAHALEHSHHIEAAIAAWQTILKRYPDAPAAATNLARLKAALNSQPPSTGKTGGSGEISL